jgi:type IV pilus assembly protein PilW
MRHSFRSQRGLTLVELMIALVIGLLITVAAASLYLVARQGFRTNDDQSRNFETGRLAVEVLSRNIRMAGAPAFVPATANAQVVEIPGRLPVTGTDGGAGGPDTITVRYFSDQPYNAGTLAGADCLGQAVGVADVVNTFSIDANGQLMCQGNGGGGGNAAQPLAAQVVDMQATYGVAAAVGQGNAAAFVNAAGVADWTLVRTVDLCFEVVSFEPNIASGPTPGTNCRGQAFPADGRVHRLFRTTVNLRNGSTGNLFPDIP